MAELEEEPLCESGVGAVGLELQAGCVEHTQFAIPRTRSSVAPLEFSEQLVAGAADGDCQVRNSRASDDGPVAADQLHVALSSQDAPPLRDLASELLAESNLTDMKFASLASDSVGVQESVVAGNVGNASLEVAFVASEKSLDAEDVPLPGKVLPKQDVCSQGRPAIVHDDVGGMATSAAHVCAGDEADVPLLKHLPASEINATSGIVNGTSPLTDSSPTESAALLGEHTREPTPLGLPGSRAASLAHRVTAALGFPKHEERKVSTDRGSDMLLVGGPQLEESGALLWPSHLIRHGVLQRVVYMLLAIGIFSVIVLWFATKLQSYSRPYPQHKPHKPRKPHRPHLNTDTYVRSHSYVGEDFFTKWAFFEGADPTHGFVQYVSHETALEMRLANASADRVYMGASTESVVGNPGRPSVRISSKEVYNKGLFVITLDHIPTGCGTWPAFWMYGKDEDHPWPAWGEYDIIEGAHKASHVITTLHTTANCDQSELVVDKDFSSKWEPSMSSSPADNCDVTAAGQWPNQGCSQTGPEGSMGVGFNTRGGGTFAAEWDPDAAHFRTWFWAQGSEPVDLVAGAPNPGVWGMPYSFFTLDPDACSAHHFKNMRLVFDLTFCGDLGSPTLQYDCPEVATAMTCNEFVANNPHQLSEAYWSILTLDVYQRSVDLAARAEGVINTSHGSTFV